jgi:hypothetical protein
MQATREQTKSKRLREELNFLRLALAHVDERLQTLTPTINTTPRFYRQLLDEKVTLTGRISDAILLLYENDSKTNGVYFHDRGSVYGNGPLRARVR